MSIQNVEDFLNLSNLEINKIVSNQGNKTMVYAFDGTRRSYLMDHGIKSLTSQEKSQDVVIDYKIYSQHAIRKLLDHLLMIFEHGISTVIYPMWFYTLEMRGPEYVPKFIGYLQGLKSLLQEPMLLDAYMKAGVRIIFYGEYKELLMRENDVKLIEVFERIMEITKNNTKRTVLLGTNIKDPSNLLIEKSINFYKKYNREPTKKELIKEYYGINVEDVSFYFGFDRFTTDGRPILLCDKGNEDLYFSVSPHSFFTVDQFRKVLYDHLYCRSVANAKEYQLKVIDVEVMKTFYSSNCGNTMGVGEVQQYGQYWSPLPQVKRITRSSSVSIITSHSPISCSGSFSEVNLVSNSMTPVCSSTSSPSSPSLLSPSSQTPGSQSPSRGRTSSSGSATFIQRNSPKLNGASCSSNDTTPPLSPKTRKNLSPSLLVRMQPFMVENI